MLRESIEINADQKLVFDVSQNYQDRIVWDSFLRQAYLINSESAKVGTRVYCRAWNGLEIETEYLVYEPVEKVTIKMNKGPFILKELTAHWMFSEKGQGTEVVFEYEFVPHLIPNFIAVKILRREMRTRLQDLKKFVEKINTK